MKVTIKGLTQATIAINSLNITLRGYNAQKDSFPTNIAHGVIVESAEVQRELDGLKKAGLIEIIKEDDGFDVSVEESQATASEYSQDKDAFSQEAEQLGLKDESSCDNTEGSDIQGDEDEPIQNSSPTVEELEEEQPVIMTAEGTLRADNMQVEIEDDSDRTKASMEAMAKLEAEEAENREEWENKVFIDRRIKEAEELTNKMGQDTVVVVDNRETEKRAMKHNAIDQAKASDDAMVYDVEKQAEEAKKAEKETSNKVSDDTQTEFSDAFIDEMKDSPGADLVEW